MLNIQNCQLWKFDSFSELYEKYVDEVYKFIYLKTYDTQIAEDITSEVFMKAINSINTFKIDKQANFRAWLYKIAYNQVIDTYKSKKEIISFEEYIDTGLETDLWKTIDNKKKLKDIFSFLDSQKKEYKDIVIMRVWWGLSYKEISQITGKSEANCKKIFSRSVATINANFACILFLILIKL